MKVEWTAVALAGFSSAAVIQPRQFVDPVNGSRLSNFASKGLMYAMRELVLRTAPEVKLVSRQTLEPQIRKEATRQKLRYGPLTIAGRNDPKPWLAAPNLSLDPNGESFIRLLQPRSICSDDCTVLGGQIYVETVDGTKANKAVGVYDHHTLSFDLSKEGTLPISACDYESFDAGQLKASKGPMAGFIGSSEDNSETPTIYTSRNGKFSSGYHLRRDNKVAVQADFVNYSNTTQDVFITYEIEFVPGIIGWDATSALLSVTGCNRAAPDISRTERTVTNSKKFPVLVDGALLGAKGHMHAGGEKMVLMINDEVVCESGVKYDDKGAVAGMGYCDVDHAIKKGDFIAMKSVYDLTKHPLRQSAGGEHGDAHSSMGGEDIMGMWGLTLAMDEKAMAKRSVKPAREWRW